MLNFNCKFSDDEGKNILNLLNNWLVKKESSTTT